MTYSQNKISHIENDKQYVFFQPINITFNYYDLHIMSYFSRHPKYESIEAMIVLDNDKEAFIRAIITRHNQTQIDYVNDESFVDKIKNEVINGREIYYSYIELDRKVEGKKIQVELKFKTIEGEKINFILYTIGKPSSRFGGLTNPEGHAQQECLPVMWRDKSTLAGAKSKVVIDGTNYKIPVKIYIPIFFKGLKGYYTEGFNIGVLSKGDIYLELVKTPEKYIGDNWIYKSGKNLYSYKITQKAGSSLIINNSAAQEAIKAEVTNMTIDINGISISDALRQEKKISIGFDPSLVGPFSIEEREKVLSKFTISMSGNQNLITGVVEIVTEGEKTIVKLIPQKPDWAAKRAIQIEISNEHKMYHLKSTLVSHHQA